MRSVKTRSNSENTLFFNINTQLTRLVLVNMTNCTNYTNIFVFFFSLKSHKDDTILSYVIVTFS